MSHALSLWYLHKTSIPCAACCLSHFRLSEPYWRKKQKGWPSRWSSCCLSRFFCCFDYCTDWTDGRNRRKVRGGCDKAVTKVVFMSITIPTAYPYTWTCTPERFVLVGLCYAGCLCCPSASCAVLGLQIVGCWLLAFCLITFRRVSRGLVDDCDGWFSLSNPSAAVRCVIFAER